MNISTVGPERPKGGKLANPKLREHSSSGQVDATVGKVVRDATEIGLREGRVFAPRTFSRILRGADDHLARPRPGRSLRDPTQMWSRAGRVLLAERIRLDTIRIFALTFDMPVLSNTWWPFAVPDFDEVSAEWCSRILALWFNSTFGILTIMANRVETEGGWIEMKKPILERMPVLDPRTLSADQQRSLIETFDALCESDLQRLSELQTDEVRATIDAGILTALGVENDGTSVRELLQNEPTLSDQ